MRVSTAAIPLPAVFDVMRTYGNKVAFPGQREPAVSCSRGRRVIADDSDSTVSDVEPSSILIRVIADVLAFTYGDAFVENGSTDLTT